jgi:cytochrome c-type biogenesis protein CcmH/NrfG
MNEQQIAYRVKQHLNQGLDNLDAGKLARLKAGREQALAHQRVGSRVSLLTWADNVVGAWGGPSSLIPRMLLPMAVLILGLVAVSQWRETQFAAEIEEIDAAVLTSDLPLDAYLDKGFDTWLKRSSH